MRRFTEIIDFESPTAKEGIQRLATVMNEAVKLRIKKTPTDDEALLDCVRDFAMAITGQEVSFDLLVVVDDEPEQEKVHLEWDQVKGSALCDPFVPQHEVVTTDVGIVTCKDCLLLKSWEQHEDD